MKSYFILLLVDVMIALLYFSMLLFYKFKRMVTHIKSRFSQG